MSDQVELFEVVICSVCHQSVAGGGHHAHGKRGLTPLRRLTVVRYSDHRSVVERLEGEREACANEADRLNAMAQEANRRADHATALIHKAIEEFERRADEYRTLAPGREAHESRIRETTYRAAIKVLRDQLSSPPEHQAEGRQTLHGLATWLVSLDEPGSVDRRTITLAEIIHQAELALEGKER